MCDGDYDIGFTTVGPATAEKNLSSRRADVAVGIRELWNDVNLATSLEEGKMYPLVISHSYVRSPGSMGKSC